MLPPQAQRMKWYIFLVLQMEEVVYIASSELGEKFELLGNGECTARCYVHEDPYIPCTTNSVQLKRSPDDNECRLACENEVACTGYTISELGIYCLVYGNISFADIARWSDPDAWMVGSRNVYGFLGFEVHASDDTSNLLCYKKINEMLDIEKMRCYCEFQNGGGNDSGILCERKGIFQKALLCGIESVCVGPYTKESAVNGTSTLCKKGVCCGNCNSGYNNEIHLNSRVSLSCDLCQKSDVNISNNWCSGDCFYDHIHEICREGSYVQLEGTWSNRQGRVKQHDSLLDAKRWCSQIGNCFGLFLQTFVHSGEVLSMNFPVLLSHGTENFIHKKEQIIAMPEDLVENETTVCLSIEFKSSPTLQYRDAVFSRQWTLESCSGPKYGLQSSSSRTIYYYDRCCLVPGKYTLTCSNLQNTYGWGNVIFTIDGKQYCDDFVGFEAMRTVIVKAATKNLSTDDSPSPELDFSSEIIVSITTKAHANENSWSFGNCRSNETYDDYKTYNISCPLNQGVYTLRCFDEYGDGWHGGFIVINGKQYCGDFNQKISEHQVQIQPSVKCSEHSQCPEAAPVCNLHGYCYENLIKQELIPAKPVTGCPDGTFISFHTCFCEDHCSWETCRLVKPPHNCLSKIDGETVWAWDVAKDAWVAQDACVNLIINSTVLSKDSSFSDYVGSYTKDQQLNGKISFKRTYEAYILTQNGTLEREHYLYLYWSPITKWVISEKLGSASALVYNSNCEESFPTKCTTEWKIWSPHDGIWHLDHSFSISCDFGAWATENVNSAIASAPFPTIETTNNVLESKVTSGGQNNETLIIGSSWTIMDTNRGQAFVNILQENQTNILFGACAIAGGFGIGYMLYSPKQVKKKPRILLHRLKIAFQVGCCFIALYFTLLFSTQYLENNDVQSIEMKNFNYEEDSQYPSFTFCFTGARFRWFKDLDIFDAYGLNATQYELMLRGGNAMRYVRNNSIRSYNKELVFFNHSAKTNFYNVHPKTEDFLKYVHFKTEKHIFQNEDEKNSAKQAKMHLSYETNDKICFSRQSNDFPKSVRLNDLITLNSSFIRLYGETKLEIFVHYPNQLLSSFESPKYSASIHHLMSVLSDTNPKILEFKLTECKRLKKRYNSFNPCNRTIKNYDKYLIQKTGEKLEKRISCVPHYFKNQLKNMEGVNDCQSPYDLKEADKLIKDVKSIISERISENDIPCDEMLVLTIDSINNNPDPTPSDISIQFFYTEKIYEEIKYLRAIGFENWLSNVGGFVGIFLGYSMMQIPEFILLFANSQRKRRCNWSEKVNGIMNKLRNTFSFAREETQTEKVTSNKKNKKERCQVPKPAIYESPKFVFGDTEGIYNDNADVEQRREQQEFIAGIKEKMTDLTETMREHSNEMERMKTMFNELTSLKGVGVELRRKQERDDEGSK